MMMMPVRPKMIQSRHLTKPELNQGVAPRQSEWVAKKQIH
jgi:hypothetical protein